MAFGPFPIATVTTSADSPDSLPPQGYTIDALKNYIFRQLGSPTWEVELTVQQILDCINDAMGLYSLWCPTERVGNIVLIRGQFRYLKGVNVGQGVSRVEFVERTPVPMLDPLLILYSPGNSPLSLTGIDEYDTFLRWRKTWMRVASVKPDWFYDTAEQLLYIHNPIERYQAAVFIYSVYSRTEGLPYAGAQWVKDYALERSRYLLGEVWSKFSGAIPGPLQNVQLDQQKRDKAQENVTKLLEQLKGMQTSTPVSID